MGGGGREEGGWGEEGGRGEVVINVLQVPGCRGESDLYITQVVVILEAALL